MARANFENDYALGLKALDDGRLTDARQYLEKALAARPEPIDKVMLSGKIEQPYLPYHFLGIVAFKLGDCEQAKALWGNPMNSRMIGRLNQIRQQEQRMLPSCQPRPTEEVSTSGQSVAPVAAPERAPAVVVPAPAVQKAPAAPAPAGSTQTSPVAPVPASAATAAQTKVSPGPRERPATPTPAEPAKPTQITAAPAERTPPPERLVQALESYLAGRYTDAVTIDPESLSGVRARFHALLIRAASRYTQAQLDGDEKLLAAARSDAAAARALDSRAVPDTAAFSPRFRAFYATAR